ncbi:MAG: ABC transporter ATP-binding protein [Nanoarchaeota archaeon]|nr:ABC transporter ATP-binding protein [Nanoarchaeota archaeon]
MGLLWKNLKKYKGLLVLALVLATINQVFSLLDPQIFRLIIDNYASKIGELEREEFFKGIGLLLLASISVALISRIAKNFQDYTVSYMTQKMGTRMYSQSVNHTFSLPYEVFEDQRSGDLLQRLQKARTDTQTWIASFINVIYLSIVGILFVVIYAFSVHWMVGATYFLIVPILGVLTFVLSKRIKEAQKKIVAESAALAGSTTETLRNVELVKSLGLESQEIGRLNEVNEKILNLELKKIVIIRKISFIQGTIINLMRVCLLLLMLWLVYTRGITLGEFFSLYIYSFFIFSPLGELGTIAAHYQEAKASNEKLQEVLKMSPQEKPVSPKTIESLKSIEFKNVEFTYKSGSKPSVRNLGLNLKGGETIAFIGPSGSGKTTLIKLLVGLYSPTKGKISINGKDSKEIDYDDLRRRVGLVSQETQLFAGTLRENLLFVNPNATDEECMQVLKLASITALLERGGNGLDTKIGEGGIKISGGERQRLAIARALLRNPDLIIFDEATSSLDSITEKEITKTIQNIIKARPNLMVVLIAHRLSTVIHADVIYVLERGKIIEKGTHNGLLKKKGLYYALWRQQSAVDNGKDSLNGKKV